MEYWNTGKMDGKKEDGRRRHFEKLRAMVGQGIQPPSLKTTAGQGRPQLNSPTGIQRGGQETGYRMRKGNNGMME